MPRSQDAKQWQPNAFEQDMIDQIANYAVIAERCSAHLRSLNIPGVKRLWRRVQADFMADPVKYPSALAQQNDIGGRRQFQLKCKAICFPPKPPMSPEEWAFHPSIPTCCRSLNTPVTSKLSLQHTLAYKAFSPRTSPRTRTRERSITGLTSNRTLLLTISF